MSNPDIQLQIDSLDRAYTVLTGRVFRASGLMTGRETWWHQFITAGFTESDLALVVRWIRHGISAGKRFEAALNFRRLIADLATFEDELATAKAEMRNAKPRMTQRERVIAQARPTVNAVPKANGEPKPIGELIAALRNSVNTH